MPSPTTVRREDFVRHFTDKQVSLDALRGDARVAPEVMRGLAGADLDRDGKIGGADEAARAFRALDSFDRDGSARSLVSASGGAATTAGSAIQALEAKAEPLARAPRRGLGGAAPVSSLGEGTAVGRARGTGYYPANNRMEGGFVDKRGAKLRTLQDYLAGRADYVSIALDKKLYRSGAVKYGDTFRIPELEAKYGRVIPFKAVDTGGAFTDKGFSRVDICTGSRRDSLDPTVNGPLTLKKVD